MKSILFDDILSPIGTSNVSGTSGDAIVWAFVLDVCSDVVEFYHHQDVWQTVLPIRFVLIGYVVSFSDDGPAKLEDRHPLRHTKTNRSFRFSPRSGSKSLHIVPEKCSPWVSDHVSLS